MELKAICAPLGGKCHHQHQDTTTPVKGNGKTYMVRENRFYAHYGDIRDSKKRQHCNNGFIWQMKETGTSTARQKTTIKCVSVLVSV